MHFTEMKNFHRELGDFQFNRDGLPHPTQWLNLDKYHEGRLTEETSHVSLVVIFQYFFTMPYEEKLVSFDYCCVILLKISST